MALIELSSLVFIRLQVRHQSLPIQFFWFQSYLAISDCIVRLVNFSRCLQSLIKILLQSLMPLMMRNLIERQLISLKTVCLNVKASLSLFFVFVNIYVDSVVLNLLVLNWRLDDCAKLVLIRFVGWFSHWNVLAMGKWSLLLLLQLILIFFNVCFVFKLSRINSINLGT